MAPFELAKEYPFQGAIWRLEADPVTGWLAVEVRNAQTLQVSFSVLDSQTDHLLMDHFQLADPWWLTLAGLQNGVLYLQGFEKSQHLGSPKGITALEVSTQKLLFSLPHLTWVKGTKVGLLLADAAGLQQWYHPEKGTLLQEEHQAQDEASLGKFRWERPVLYSPESAYFQQVADYILQREGHLAEQEIAYLETKTFFCLGYHFRKENIRFMNFLVTYTLGGEPLRKFCLSSEAEAVGEPGFFVIADKLFLLPDPSTLTSYCLASTIS